VKITTKYSPPSSFSFDPPSYRAASALSLTCVVKNEKEEDGLFFEWSSTCSGNCFAWGKTSRTISTAFLHSYDTGEYTCMVHDAINGNTGNASINVSVVGK